MSWHRLPVAHASRAGGAQASGSRVLRSGGRILCERQLRGALAGFPHCQEQVRRGQEAALPGAVALQLRLSA